MERRVHAVEQALGEMQHFMQATNIRDIDPGKAKEVYNSLSKVVQELLNNPVRGGTVWDTMVRGGRWWDRMVQRGTVWYMMGL